MTENTITSRVMARVGAFFYIAWGIVHIKAAYDVVRLAKTIAPGIVQGRVLQDAWLLFFIACFVILVSLHYNWYNEKLGYWINFWLTSLSDISFILFILLPAYIPFWPGVVGPLLWLLGLLFTTLARSNHK